MKDAAVMKVLKFLDSCNYSCYYNNNYFSYSAFLELPKTKNKKEKERSSIIKICAKLGSSFISCNGLARNEIPLISHLYPSSYQGNLYTAHLFLFLGLEP
jgi:hypothetical protein